MLNIVRTRNTWFILSGILMVAAVVALIAFHLKLGIDFEGGTLAEIKFIEKTPPVGDLESVVLELDGKLHSIQPTNEGAFIIRTAELSEEEHRQLTEKLNRKFGKHEELRFDTVGPTISAEVTRRAFYQLVLVSAGILAYIAWAFRRVPKPLSSWRFGWAAIIALIHDLLFVIGVFAVLGKFMNVEIDALFVTALLTVLGFSVHDTIIVFDRIRENLRRLAGERFPKIVSRSINQTVVRSINTSTTVIFVLVALLLFGGQTIQFFVLALLIGIVVGTYSSIFIASPLLYVFHRSKFS